ncbi:hypothetical protein RJ639_009354 [Escallonia herrerae]|uniref:Ripening-related protein 1 n=1 Tax=Escallonia herrerae TaxID=1293975 RepID=A0AA88VR52_9ASTE|nr:hypothetical protein RJ639_009354 [Escallonia herrerae]
MKKQVFFSVAHLQVLLLVVSFMAFTTAQGQTCRPSGRIRGQKPPKNQCNTDNGADCCKEGHFYTTYKCSPPVSGHTKAILTINDFQKDGDGGAPVECDGHYHSNKKPVVALSTGWFNHMKRCHKFINIHGNGRTATVITTPTKNQWWLYRPGATNSSTSMEMEGLREPWWSTSVTQLWVATKITPTSPRVRITSLMPQKQFGRLWAFQRILQTGVGWKSLGLMHDLPLKT